MTANNVAPAKVADVNAYVLSEVSDWESDEVDGVHPDDALYIKILNNVLAPAVAAQVSQLECK
jgi:hypothetical protein